MSSATAPRRHCSVLSGCLRYLAHRCSAAGIALLLGTLATVLVADRAAAQSPGTVDATYTLNRNNLTAFTLALQADLTTKPRILIGGDIREFERTMADGTVDASFAPPITFGGPNRTVYTMAFETTVPGTEIGTIDSRLYIGGLFGVSVDPTTFVALKNLQNITRIKPDGTLDATFNPTGVGTNNEVTAILPFPASAGSGLLVGGIFTKYNNEQHLYLVKLNNDGSVDANYNANLRASDAVYSLAAQIDSTTGLPNGQVLVAGRFNRVNRAEFAKLARLNADGTLDDTFNPDFPTRVLTIAVQPDGKIIAGGDFDSANGQPVNNIVRLNQDGTTDPTFSASATGNVNPVNTPPTAINVVKLVPDGSGRMIIGGNFLSVNGALRRNLARLESDGTLDADFDPGDVLLNRVQSVAVQADEKVLVALTRINRASDAVDYPKVVYRLYGGDRPLPTVSIIATDKHARKGTRQPAGAGQDDGQFEIVRTEPLTNALTVFYTRAGSAFYPVDYKLLDGTTFASVPDSITIPAGESSVTIDLRPKRKSKAGVPNVTAKLRLSANIAYIRGTARSAKVKILPPMDVTGQ